MGPLFLRIASRIGDGTATIFEGKSKDMPELKKLQQNDMMHYFAKEGVKSIQFAKHEVPDLKMIADEKDGGGGVKPPQISIYFYHPDHLGTNTIVTDMAGNTYQYFLNLPFGETMAEQLGSGYFQSPYKFNGKESDAETGLYYYGARYYDPRTSVWLSVDPLAWEYSGLSPYTYVLDNPMGNIDFEGKKVISSPKFMASVFGKVFQKLKSKNKAFQKELSIFEGDKYNLNISIDNKKILSKAPTAALTEHHSSTPNETQTFYSNKTSVPGNSNYEYTVLGIVVIVTHESIHQKLSQTEGVNEDDNHNVYNKYRTDLVNILTEYNTTNKLGLTDDQITALSYSGQEESTDFKTYITDLAKDDKISYDEEKEKYDKVVSKLFYKKKSKNE